MHNSIARSFFIAALALLSFHVVAKDAKGMPHFQENSGRHALIVDGEPYLILGVQANNSSNYPAALKDVWPTVEQVDANTLEIPVAWEQIEPQENHFDFSYLDVLLKEARQHHVRLVLLWFATWKNNAPNYAPAWVKLDNKRFPRVVKQDGTTVNSLSPMYRGTLEADKKAFIALMTYLKKEDRDHTVIMVQVENEVGTYGEVRDYSKVAQAEFVKEVPADLRDAFKLPEGSWSAAFGENADEFFHAYYIARYVDEIVAAGKAVYPLPMYLNVALRSPFNPGKPGQYSSGGATDNVIPIWKLAAPNIDMISPDIYFHDYKSIVKIIELYSRPDNPLFVPEIGNGRSFARYIFAVLGHHSIGFSPFGMDTTGYYNYPLGAQDDSKATFEVFAEAYRLLRPWARAWAKLSFNNETWGFSEQGLEADNNPFASDAPAQDEKPKRKQDIIAASTQNADLGRWNVEVTYGRPMFWIKPPQGNSPPSGGALIAKLSEDEFLVTALRARVTFLPSDETKGQRYMMARVEEGHFDSRGKWVFERIWNGDEADWGLNFDGKYHLLKVKMATY